MKTISSATCWRKRTGRSCAFRRSPRTTRPGRSIRTSDGTHLPGSAARHCTPSASHWRPSSRSAARLANTISPANTSRPRRRRAAAWSRRRGSGITRQTNGRTVSTALCRAGTPPTRRASSAISASAPPGGSTARTFTCCTCCASAWNIPSSSAVREQCQAFEASVVLIEDKASGTQLIQELIQEGLHAVTRYQPQSDKVMRMHAQTAMIENGFVHLPKEAVWLAEYLHELTAFPRGRHDDQVDSTAQMLDWFKQAGSGPTSNAGIWHLYREQYEAQQAALQNSRPEPLSVMARRLGILRPL